ncbi:hypothetical protein CR513_02945, partial [Mucuna pruriens]
MYHFGAQLESLVAYWQYISHDGLSVFSLIALVAKEEVKTSLVEMKSYKTLGIDGFQPYFFKKY